MTYETKRYIQIQKNITWFASHLAVHLVESYLPIIGIPVGILNDWKTYTYVEQLKNQVQQLSTDCRTLQESVQRLENELSLFVITQSPALNNAPQNSSYLDSTTRNATTSQSQTFKPSSISYSYDIVCSFIKQIKTNSEVTEHTYGLTGQELQNIASDYAILHADQQHLIQFCCDRNLICSKYVRFPSSSTRLGQELFRLTTDGLSLSHLHDNSPWTTNVTAA